MIKLHQQIDTNGHPYYHGPIELNASKLYYDNRFNATMSQPMNLQNKNQTLTPHFQNDPLNSSFLEFMITFSQYAHLYYIPLLTFAGTIGNVISVLVFFRTKLKKLSSSYYLSALCISDTGFLLVNFVSWLNIFDINIYSHNVFCQVLTFCSGFCSALSVWFVVAFTIERFIAVLYPLKRPTVCTLKRAKSILIGLMAWSAIHSLPLIVLSAPVYASTTIDTEPRNICGVKEGYEIAMKYYNFYDTTLSFILPLTLITILNFITAYTIWEIADVRKTMTNHKRKCIISHHMEDFRRHEQRLAAQSNRTEAPFQTDIQSEHTKMMSSGVQLETYQSKSSFKQTRIKSTRLSASFQMKVTKMLLFVSTIFVLLNLPSYVFRILQFVMDEFEGQAYILAGQYVAQQLFITNFGINFVLYCMSGQNFRKETINLFHRKSKNREAMAGGTQVTIMELVANNNGFNRIRTTKINTTTYI